MDDGLTTEPTLAALAPFSSASLSYPIGASSLYGPVLLVNLTVEVSVVRTGRVVVSVADGAMLYDWNELLIFKQLWWLSEIYIHLFHHKDDNAIPAC